VRINAANLNRGADITILDRPDSNGRAKPSSLAGAHEVRPRKSRRSEKESRLSVLVAGPGSYFANTVVPAFDAIFRRCQMLDRSAPFEKPDVFGDGMRPAAVPSDWRFESSLEALGREGRRDLVILCTPHFLQPAMTGLLMRKGVIGKNTSVIFQKPLANSVVEAEHLKLQLEDGRVIQNAVLCDTYSIRVREDPSFARHLQAGPIAAMRVVLFEKHIIAPHEVEAHDSPGRICSWTACSHALTVKTALAGRLSAPFELLPSVRFSRYSASPLDRTSVEYEGIATTERHRFPLWVRAAKGQPHDDKFAVVYYHDPAISPSMFKLDQPSTGRAGEFATILHEAAFGDIRRVTLNIEDGIEQLRIAKMVCEAGNRHHTSTP
jgi:hypothetical protein